MRAYYRHFALPEPVLPESERVLVLDIPMERLGSSATPWA